MLNLRVGEYYELTMSPSNIVYAGRIISVNNTLETFHSYFIAWPKDELNIFKNPTGLYVFDKGWCEIHKKAPYDTCFRESGIIKCRKLNLKEGIGMRLYFKTRDVLKELELYAVRKSYEDIVRYRKLFLR